MKVIRMVVLTKSSKYGKNCVAGINLGTGEWVRLVTNDESSHGAVSDENLVCEFGERVQILDIIDVPILCICEDEIQPENVLLNLNVPIQFVGKMPIEEVIKIHPLEIRKNILGNTYSYVREERAESIGYSLTLIQVNNLQIIQERNPLGKPKTKAAFFYNGQQYENMSVTDERFYSVISGTSYQTAILVISIGTPYNGKHYKFVSAIYVPGIK